MRCDWKSFIELLPFWLRPTVDRQGRDNLLELRLRLGHPPELVMMHGSAWLERKVLRDDLLFCINTASRYSPWAASSVSKGFITAQGGHRMGLSGVATVSNSMMTGIREPTSICLRVAREFPGIASRISGIDGSILILGKPGCGKTTLLRDLIRTHSNLGPGSIAVVDEKCELFPFNGSDCIFEPGARTDILSGCSKKEGIDAVLRNMGPAKIAVDEITSSEDTKALIRAGWCGVELFATAHATDIEDLSSRPVYRPLIQSGLFETVVLLQPDKSFRLERMNR